MSSASLSLCCYLGCAVQIVRALATSYRHASLFALSPLLWTLLSCVLLSVDLALKVASVLVVIPRLTEDALSNVALSAGASAGIYGYCAVASAWLRVFEATRKADRIETRQLRRSRRFLAVLAALFMLAVLVLVGLTVAVDISYYIWTVALDMVAALCIAIAFQYGACALNSLGRNLLRDVGAAEVAGKSGAAASASSAADAFAATRRKFTTSMRLQLIARTATRVSLSLSVFILACILWIIARGARNVGPAILAVILGLEWMAVMVLHAAHACGMALVAGYYLSSRRALAASERHPFSANGAGGGTSRHTSPSARGSDMPSFSHRSQSGVDEHGSCAAAARRLSPSSRSARSLASSLTAATSSHAAGSPRSSPRGSPRGSLRGSLRVSALRGSPRLARHVQDVELVGLTNEAEAEEMPPRPPPDEDPEL